MNLSDVKNNLENVEELNFILPDGSQVPSHFHVTEIGHVKKKFIDCGGVIREEEFARFQLWSSIDIHHRLQAKKLKDIINLSQQAIGLSDLPVEVEYQGKDTISKYGLEFDGQQFLLTTTQTDCLAKNKCAVPDVKKQKLSLSTLNTASCGPDSSCC